MIYGRIYGFFLTRFGYYYSLHFRDCGILRGRKRFFDESADLATTPPPPPTLDSRYFARAKWISSAAPSELIRLLVLPEISGFFGIPIGQPWSRLQEMVWNLDQQCKNYGMRISRDKTEVMVTSREPIQCDRTRWGNAKNRLSNSST